MIKKILITGANSYIGTSLEKCLEIYPDKYYIDTMDMKTNNWKIKNFSEFDVVFHVAGLVHIKETKKNKELYYKVNRDLAYEVAKKSKSEGVKQFIFLSSLSVYGITNGIINYNTSLKPNNNYGMSKLMAEELIKALSDDTFNIAIIRPPMIYGKNCKGNYPKLAKLAINVPFFPDIENNRSMIYIDNMCEFVRLLIDENINGFFVPQNSNYVNTSEMVKLIAKVNGKNIKMTKIFNPIIRLLKTNTINKVFGDLIFDKDTVNSSILASNGQKINYEIVSFEESISKTEMR
jgi:UDP-glucose 4-epimerase